MCFVWTPEPAPEGRFPWIVSIRGAVYQHVCRGTLIDQQHILTAAHCLDQGTQSHLLASNPSVYIGFYNSPDGASTPEVQVNAQFASSANFKRKSATEINVHLSGVQALSFFAIDYSHVLISTATYCCNASNRSRNIVVSVVNCICTQLDIVIHS